VTRRHPGKILVLKTPNHGAHITELVSIFGDHVRFLHVSREPSKVIESNLRMHDALSRDVLEDPIDPTTLRALIVEEYLQMETATIEQAQSLDEGRIAFVTHENLIADPLGQLSKGYESLGLELSQAHQASIIQYLTDLGTYERPPHPSIDLGIPSESEADTITQLLALRQPQHQATPVPLPETTPPQPPRPPVRTSSGMLGAFAVTILWGALWIGLIWVIKQIYPEYRPRLDQLVWIGGSVIGLFAVKIAGGGSKQLGLAVAALTLLIFVSVSFPITVINWHFAQHGSTQDFLYHNTKGALHGLLAPSSIIYAVLGMLTAWRHASTTGPMAPGT
jgi:hypothetical protein